jgi:hypothetical protein
VPQSSEEPVLVMQQREMEALMMVRPPRKKMVMQHQATQAAAACVSKPRTPRQGATRTSRGRSPAHARTVDKLRPDHAAREGWTCPQG